MIHKTIYLFILLALIKQAPLAARDIEPFVSTDWLEQNANTPGLLVLDIRKAADYRKDHIKGSLNAGVNFWAVNKDGLLRELPDAETLTVLISFLGIKVESKVVVAGYGATDFDRADAIRVAWTLLAAGIGNVSVLDGGYAKWLNDKKPLTQDPVLPSAGEYKGKLRDAGIVSKKYVQSKIGKSALVDARTPDVYFGITTESWAPKPGHIPSAVNIPAPWLFTQEGLVRGRGDLERMVTGVIGTGKAKEYIVYCGAGPYATVLSYIMTEMLGYRNVKVYDGSMQEWVMDPSGPLKVYSWR